MALPPDRSTVATEQRHPASTELDLLTSREIVALMAEDHRAAIDAVSEAGEALAELVDELWPRMARGGRLIYLGAGTSGRLGVLDASECPPTFQSDPTQVVGLIAGGDSALRRSSEGAEDDAEGAAAELDRLDIGATDSVVGIAAGGTTPYVLGGLRIAKRRGAATTLLTCSPRERPEGCDRLIVLRSGAEVLTGSTRLKAGTATKLALNCITTALFVRLGKTHGNLMVDLRATNDKLRDRAHRVLRTLHPELDAHAAAEALAAAGGSLKVASVMHAHGVDRHAAEAKLSAVGGRLRHALDGEQRRGADGTGNG